ncbi:hypothetical protein RND81_09G239200 [Saponaria officinalis]|uniref:Uncharacterized protein n=1 Tax=Saponaria officinalis TaxID=3572 RepID=A0AAW1IRN8_SAPOF
MRRGSKNGMKQRSNQPLQKRTMESEDSDEDYVAEVDEQSDDLDSLVGDASAEESCFEEEIKAEKKEEEDEDGWRTVVKPKPTFPNGSSRSMNNGVSRPRKRTKVKHGDDDDSDDDDEEFKPDFEYLDDDDDDDDDEDEDEEDEYNEEDEDDEEFLKSKSKSKTNKRGRTKLKRKNSVRTVRRKRTVRKPSKKRSKRVGSSERKSKSGVDEEFVDEAPALRGRTKGRPRRLKKTVAVKSDSDICSDSSDREFTISEEEREQIREANLFCRTLAVNLRSSRKSQDDEPFCEPKKPPAKKGKEKAVETKNDTGKPVCGICLTEEAKNSVRGTLNCCSHYFCFACIMEWSKVETRCPLCKQRFVTISKPTKCGKGFDLRNAVITVPERDQVYQPSEEELRDFLNPYENVICTECHQGGDDALMLLCDVCDSPAHTYCVGLGREVPEGNWYCDGCRPAVLASSHSQIQGRIADQRAGADASDRQPTYENMAEIDLNVTIPETQFSQGEGFLPSPRFSGGSLPSPVSGIGVSTVSGRRRIHRQIRYILSNRISQTGGDISSLGNMIGLGVDTTFHRGRTDVGTSHHAQQIGRFHEYYPHSVQNTDFGRLGDMMGHVGQPLTAVDGSLHGHRAWSGLDNIHLESTQASLFASGPLQPCTSRSSFLPDVGGLSSENRVEEHTNIPKNEVHSIVVNQLKSLSRDMNLGQNIYTEIIRRSTDTIMAAYGLEPRRHDTFSVQAAKCMHLDSLAYVETSPMNGCCLVCFRDFVKLVVQRVMDILMAPHWQDFRH